MKYLIVSDSHHKNDYLKYLINYYKGYEVIHLGDKKMDVKGINIKGNCDENGIDELVIEIDNHKVFLTHGHYYQVKWTFEYLYQKLNELNCDIALFGHTHKKTDETRLDKRIINPGALQDGYYIIYDEEFIFKRLGE